MDSGLGPHQWCGWSSVSKDVLVMTAIVVLVEAARE